MIMGILAETKFPEGAMSKPDIPKRLAARIRAAQAKVKDKREYLVLTHQGILSAASELAGFDSDPKAYALDRYGALHGVDSYPVQTRVGRLREAADRRQTRIPDIEMEIIAAERDLERVEEEVFREVSVMRPSTGRVAWPKPLGKFRGAIGRGLANRQKEIDAEPENKAAYLRAIAAERLRDDAIAEEETRKEDEAEARRIANLSPEEIEAERASIREFFEHLDARGLSVSDLFSVTVE